ncbi:MAG TPA: ABC transporter permease [Lachnospiraceae bacterium]|nr:ABC transporter permease [Lachnospiraceae bacterium]
MGIFIGVLEQGLIYGVMALGIYITYKILDFPDLTVDGSFPMGAAVTAVLLTKGVNPYLALLVSFLAGAAAGICTGLIHVKLKVRDLLSGIIMMTALYSINLRITGKVNVPLFTNETVLENKVVDEAFARMPQIQILIVALIIALIVKILLDTYLKTKSGYLLRAVGDNETIVTSLAKDKGMVKIIGLAIANALVALGGSVMCQQQRFFDVSMGTGTMVIGLASVIIGTNIFKNSRIIKPTTAVLIGSIIYKGCVAFAISRGLKANDMKLITSVLFLVIIVITMDRKRKVKGNA